MSPLQRRVLRIPGFIRFPMLVGPLALGVYHGVTRTGIAALLVDLQVSLLDGSYYPKLTVLLAMAAYGIPAAVLLVLIAGFFPEKER